MTALWNPTRVSCVGDGQDEDLCRQSLYQDELPAGEPEQGLEAPNTDETRRSNQQHVQQYLNLCRAKS